MSIFTDISNALDSRLNTMAGLPPVAWPNTEYTPTEGVLYLRANNLPNDASTIDQGYTEQHGGIYQVDVIAPLDKGRLSAETMADNIADHFSSSRLLTSGSVSVHIRATTRRTASRDGAFYFLPVFIEYRVYANR